MTKTIGTIIADFTTTLASKISAGATSLTLLSATDSDGVSLPSGKYLFTVSPDDSSKEYLQGDLVSTSVTNLKHVSRQGALTTGCLYEHRKTATISITNFPDSLFLNNLLDGTTDLNSLTPLKYDGTPTVNNNAQIASKAYIDGVSITSPIADATISVNGKVLLSVAPVSAGSPIAAGNNDTRIPTADVKAALAGTGTPSAGNKFVTEDNSGLTGNLLLTTDQTVDGVKTFTSIPVSSAGVPTTDNQIATKGYVDSK
jgi:hypothetical protein